MESRVNFIIVGIFVVLFSIGLIAFAFWLGKYGDDSDYVYYKAYMTESVSGLSKDATVKFRGVDVGIVDKIAIDRENSERIILQMKVERLTPITKDMHVEMKYYGLTGLAFIEISGGSKDAPLHTHDTTEIPVIQTSPSVYARLDESLSSLAGKLSHTLDSIDLLLSKQNIDNFQQSLENIKDISVNLKDYQDEIQKLLVTGVDMEKDIIAASNKVALASDSVEAAARAFEKSFSRGDYDLRSITSKSLEKFDDLLGSLKVLTGEIEEAVISIKNSPGDLLFKQTEQKLGPGEQLQ